MLNNSHRIVEYSLNHLTLVLTVTGIALALWIPTGLLISRYERFSGLTMALGNLLFCIPSLSLFGIFMTVPHLGLGRRSAVLALVLYAMMPLVRNVYRGIKSVDRHVVEAGRGMGMSNLEILWQIQLPLAWPIIFAGIRVTVVLVTGIATIATYIGERNLGRLIQHGITRSNAEMIIAGAILVSILALLLDYLLGRVERRLISPGTTQVGVRKGQEESF